MQDELDPCLFIDVVRDICTREHVDDMLAVGPKDATRQLSQDLAKDMGMRLEHGDREPTDIIRQILVQDDEGLPLRCCG